MVRFEGDRDLPQPPDVVWAKVADARFLVSCIPDVESVKQVDDDTAMLVIRPGLSFVRGTLEVTLRILERVEATTLKVELFSKGIGATSKVRTALALAALDAGTRVHWTAEVAELTGLLKLAPSGLVRGAAQKVIGDVWNNVAARLSA